ncbi:MAG: hypothetical protein H6522_07450 [Mycolicibacterium sp.]|nr:hypothetical protein [Mycolicibacterium sp.]
MNAILVIEFALTDSTSPPAKAGADEIPDQLHSGTAAADSTGIACTYPQSSGDNHAIAESIKPH